MLKGKKIVLGITGSIAAYKSTPITLSALTQKPVISDFFSQRDGTWHSHVALGLWADAMLIAPCTASTLGKMANGIADNMLITTYLSMKAPVFIAPAMDLDMYAHPTTQQNMERLKGFGNHIIEPQSGFLASGLEGKGRMEDPEKIVAAHHDYRWSNLREDRPRSLYWQLLKWKNGFCPGRRVCSSWCRGYVDSRARQRTMYNEQCSAY